MVLKELVESSGAGRLLHIDEAKLKEASQNVKTLAGANFQIENKIKETEIKIKDHQHQVNRKKEEKGKEEKKKADSDPFVAHREHYGTLFYLLHAKTNYLASITQKVAKGQSHSFVQTVVMDLYGDQFSSRDERLLLLLFRDLLSREVATSTMGTFLRANTTFSQLLSAYARRGAGITTLKEIFAAPLSSILKKTKLNLEIIPTKVYQELISEEERTTGQESKLDKKASDDVQTAHPDVIRIVGERGEEIAACCQLLLDSITNAVDKIPFGIRWICKQIHSTAKEAFPDATRQQLGSLVGGYIYLRFFMPALVAPESIALCDEPSKKARRNLVICSKVLQNLSNGIIFGDKESFMRVCNPFLERATEVILQYFERIIDVLDDTLDEKVELDMYLGHTSDRHILLNVNQVYLMHQLCQAHLSLTNDGIEPIARVMSQLGSPPPLLDKKEDRQVSLHLLNDINSDLRRSSVISATAAPTREEIFGKVKILMEEAVRLVDCTAKIDNISTYFTAEANKHEAGSREARVLTMIASQLDCMHQTQLCPGVNNAECVSNFLDDFIKEINNRASMHNKLQAKLKLVKEAETTISAHNKFLIHRLESYKEVYADLVMKDVLSKAPNARDNNSKNQAVVKSAHESMVEMRVITRIIPEFYQQQLKSGVTVKYTFTQETKFGSQILVTVTAKKRGFAIPGKMPSISLDVTALSESDAHLVLLPPEDPFVEMNRNLLLHYLHTSFKFSNAKIR